MNAAQKWDVEQNARRVWEAAAAKRQELQDRLDGATACYEQTKRERDAIEDRITQAVAGTGTLEAAFRGEVAQLRGDCDRLARQIMGLQKLIRIIAGEEKRAHDVWKRHHDTLFDRDRPGVYDGEILTLMAERGAVCVGHRVSLHDESDDSVFDCVLTGSDTPVERAVRHRAVGDWVMVDAPGGAYRCQIIAVETVTAG
jgi:transcription elongation GreA/GreB family factor